MKDYGNGNSTGLDQTAAGKNLHGIQPRGPCDDRRGPRGPADAGRKGRGRLPPRPAWREVRRLWTTLNRLEKTRPLVFCDPENGWNEIITEPQMQCRGKLARRWEMDLRKEIFWGEVMGDDKPVEPYFDVPYTVSPDDWGLKADYQQTDESRLLHVARRGEGLCHGPEAAALAAVRDRLGNDPRLPGDRPATCWAICCTVRLKGMWWWSLGLTWLAATFRGLQNMLCDFIEHPDELKELLAIISRGLLDKLDYLEAKGLLSLNNDGTYVGSGGFGFTDELPQADFAGRVRPCDMWGFTESQETLHVSPAMYEEFIFPNEKPIMERFGLTCYGCCEPLHGRWHVGQAASASPPRFLFAVGGRGEDGRVLGDQVHLLAQGEPGRPGGAAHRSKRPSAGGSATTWRRPAAASWNSS